jgi:methyltransferase (TIGR00027 family)
VPRTDNDTWDITESVGATALGVAAARAAETESDDPLVRDPYAKMFLEAVGDGIWTRFSGAAQSDELVGVDPEFPERMMAMRDYVACRTVFFDDFFLSAAEAGVRQAVILAAGLDARAWRLPWPAGSIVYELDQPKVLEFKAATLQAAGARPTAVLVSVPIDLRQDWPAALKQAGHDATAPTAWTAEGLLPFLPAAGQDLLFERIHSISAPGSRVAVEAMDRDFLDPGRIERQRAMMQRYRTAAAELGQRDIPQIDDLWYFEERTDVGDWLRGRGWDVSVATARELLQRNDRSTRDHVQDAVPGSLFVSAQRT